MECINKEIERRKGIKEGQKAKERKGERGGFWFLKL